MAKGCSRRRIRGGGRTIEELEAAVALLPESTLKNEAIEKIKEANKKIAEEIADAEKYGTPYPLGPQNEDMGQSEAADEALKAAEAAVAAAEAEVAKAAAPAAASPTVANDGDEVDIQPEEEVNIGGGRRRRSKKSRKARKSKKSKKSKKSQKKSQKKN